MTDEILGQDRVAHLLAGAVSRREVLRRGAQLGLTAPVLASLLAACGGSDETPADETDGDTDEPTATATTPTELESSSSETPEPSTSGERGSAGTLNLLWWQAPVVLNTHFSSGQKDLDASRLVLEPLAEYVGAEGELEPILAAEIPSIENGDLAADGMSVTWRLKKGVTWSDGEPFTAEDVVFTYEFVSDPATAATSVGYYTEVESVEALDEHTVHITFKEPTPSWFVPFCGQSGTILPKHILQDYVGEAAKTAPFNLNPIGTGPFKVEQFVPGDSAEWTINENYRDPDRPFFAHVSMKGGGDAVSAARAVLQTGEYDYAWNTVVTPEVLESLDTGEFGRIELREDNKVEYIVVNFSDPRTEVDGQRSHLGTPHPFQTDLKVRQAYALAIQRDVIAERLYGITGKVAVNRIVTPPRLVSPNTSWRYDLEEAARLLTEAGWEKGSDGIWAKDGVKMQILFQTTNSAVRQRTQEIIKASFQELGIEVELKAVEASVFFTTGGNPDSSSSFYADIQMYTTAANNPFPVRDMQAYYGAPDNIAQKENNWSGVNVTRWQNSEYDALFEQLQTELDPEKQRELFIKLNDLVVNEVCVIPLVNHSGVSVAANDLTNLELSLFTTELWNIANWNRTSNS